MNGILQTTLSSQIYPKFPVTFSAPKRSLVLVAENDKDNRSELLCFERIKMVAGK